MLIKNVEEIKAKAGLKKASFPLLLGISSLIVVIIFSIVLQLITLFKNSDTSIIESSREEDSETVYDQQSVEIITNYFYIHVVGAVEHSGIYRLHDGCRVADAIEAAGGFSENADENYLNLARSLSDGEQIYVPTMEETAAVTNDALAFNYEGNSSNNQSTQKLVNINTADSAELQSLSGIGEKTAEKIIAYRENNGAFQNIEDLKKVSGIGEKKYEAIADAICV